MDERSDTISLIVSIQKGQTEDFAKLYELYSQKIYSFVFYKIMDKDTAEDLTSETFMKALNKIKTYDSSKSAFNTWLFNIARNTVIDHFRVYKNHEDLNDVWELASLDDVESSLDLSLNYEHLHENLKNLSVKNREILMMRFWQDLSYREIAEILGKSEGSVKMQASRTIKTLKKEFLLLFLLAF